MDIYHTGKEDANDDHKFINERLLEVAVPEDPGNGRAIALEDCLETYFNNRIEVKRYLERRRSSHRLQSMESMDSNKEPPVHNDMRKPNDSLTVEPLPLQSPAEAGSQELPALPLQADHRSPSIVKEYFISEKCDLLERSPSTERESRGAGQKRAGSLRKVHFVHHACSGHQWLLKVDC